MKPNLRCKMEQYIIKGGTPLNGEVEISGAKNAALAILAAAVMTVIAAYDTYSIYRTCYAI